MALENILTNLLNAWRLEESSGTRFDAVGSLDMTPSGSVGQGVGMIGNAADFTGGLLSGGTSSSLDFIGNTDFTIAGWFNPDTVNVDKGIISKYTHPGNEKQWGVFIDDTSPVHINFILSIDGVTVFQAGFGTTTIATGVWYFFWADYAQAANVQRVRVNQGVTSSIAGPSVINSSTAIPRIGVQSLAGGDNDFEFDGLLDELLVWDRLLTDTEKDDLYNGGDGVNIFGVAPATKRLSVPWYYG